MIEEEEARTKVLENIQVQASRKVSLSHGLSCFAAEDYFSSLPLPNFDNSAMDGMRLWQARAVSVNDYALSVNNLQAWIDNCVFRLVKRFGFLPARQCPLAQMQW